MLNAKMLLCIFNDLSDLFIKLRFFMDVGILVNLGFTLHLELPTNCVAYFKQGYRDRTMDDK